MSTSFITRRRNLLEPKPKRSREPFYFGDIFSVDLILGLLMILPMMAIVGMMIFYVIPTFQNHNNLMASVRAECGFSPSQAARGEGLRFADGSVGFVTMKESGKKVPVEVVRTEKQLAFTNFESHETLCSIKL
jgi:hypothetical protein